MNEFVKVEVARPHNNLFGEQADKAVEDRYSLPEDQALNLEAQELVNILPEDEGAPDEPREPAGGDAPGA